ncbi:uncharacterized protein MAM_06862 [Metarhizium album ARSEF 1941]|uniref:Uncharacterized protein n=1 Tax=Metarhizium album (strain ARSEF 1941) TaxID=1081103 RepID=A0A0B2WN52_METAS|nr:uncharacterized protein MAM_06862 [Metarhizium album ARSEF 1941]KHN95358.1 hypothetical protein MAM_06862 [Metarhizium album ARSEF 1941]
MDPTTKSASYQVPELLFHTILTVIDYSHDASGASRTTFVLGTHGTLEAAKAFAVQSLESVNFKPDDFQKYHVKHLEQETPGKTWIHGDGVLVFARSFDGQEFRVSIDTTPNNESLHANTQDGEMRLPEGAKFLHYVVQTIIDYNVDRSGSLQTTEIQGVYVHRADAWTAAHKCLAPDEFAEYDCRGDTEFVEAWPFGDNVAVHAVSETGQNYLIAVNTPPQHRHDIKRHGRKKSASA